MRRLWLALLFAAGCGRIGYSELVAADGGPAGDFGPATELVALSAPGAVDDDPTLSGDQLELYFKSNRTGSYDIFRTRRASIGAPWDPAVRVDELSTPQDEDTPELSADGLVLHFASARAGGSGGTDLWRSARASRTEPWGPPERVAELSSGDHEYAAALDGSGRHVVLTRLGGAGLDLFRASRADASSPWGPVVAIAELNTAGAESDAWQDASGTVLYFASDRPGGAGGSDLWWSVRATPDAPFGPPANVASLATPDGEGDPWLSPDGRTIYFSRTVGGDTQLFVAER